MLNNEKLKFKNCNFNFFKKNKESISTVRWFTLSEVLIATLISGIVLSMIFVFLWNISNWIVDSKHESSIMSNLYDFSNKLKIYRNNYNTWWILVDSTSTWSDVFLMKDSLWQNGVLLWIIKLEDKKLDNNITVYENRWIWFRKVSSSELVDINTDINTIYWYTFQDDQIFSDLKVQDLSFYSYNSWSIYDMVLTVDNDFQNSLVWLYWSELPRDNLKKFNLDF